MDKQLETNSKTKRINPRRKYLTMVLEGRLKDPPPSVQAKILTKLGIPRKKKDRFK